VVKLGSVFIFGRVFYLSPVFWPPGLDIFNEEAEAQSVPLLRVGLAIRG